MAIPKKCKVSVLESPKKMVLKTVDIPAVLDAANYKVYLGGEVYIDEIELWTVPKE